MLPVTPRGLSEAAVEEAALGWFRELGYEIRPGHEIAPDGPAPERLNYGETILTGRLRAALRRLNGHLPAEVIEAALPRVTQAEFPTLIEENRRLHGMMVDGLGVEVARDDGTIAGDRLWLVDFDNPDANDWLALNQFTVIENRNTRRADVVVFVNGLPLGVLELKKPGDEDATLRSAFDQLRTYKAEIPSLFRANAVLVTANGIAARMGSLTAESGRFMPWRTTDGRAVAPKGWPELQTLIEGVFEKSRLLDLVRGYTVFSSDGEKLEKIVAGYHQFHAVRHAVECTIAASRPEGDRRAGVIWHTQGSGKSLLMVFYAGRLIVHPAMENPTVVVITDRNDLDEQLFTTFSRCQALLRQTPVQARSREHLRELLQRPSGGVIFTTIQKFAPEEGTANPALSERRNVVAIADEAHRSQYGLKARVSRATGDFAYGFAKHMRDALPGASFIGFTGTPIDAADVNTRGVFGDYIDVYDISRAVDDDVTVPIYYESRLARIELDEDERPTLDAEIEEVLEEADSSDSERLKGKWARVEALVGAEKRLKLIAADIVTHFEARAAALQGKGMIVCMSRRICAALYDQIVALRPEWHADEDEAGALKVVMTGSASDPPGWQRHIRGKAKREEMAKRARNPDDPLKLVIVRDMWLTGFDAPCMHTMYIDKPMRGHGLMQAIARVNRVFKDKPGGLVVDYIGLAQNLKDALADYSESDRRQAGIDEAQAVAVMLEKYEVVRDMFHGFDYRGALAGPPEGRLVAMAGALEWVLEMQRRDAERESSEEGKKRAWRRYGDAVLALTRAFALASASDAAGRIRDEVGFFQALRAALAKSDASPTRRRADLDLAVQQIVSRAVASTEIIDILEAAGLETPDISILSDEFLDEVRAMERKNLALEALRKLINGEIRSKAQTNVVQIRSFTERLEDAIARYHNNALTTVQVIEELIALARDIRAARQRGEEAGLSDEEIAFYDALADNASAREVMGDERLRVIAHELLTSVKSSVGVDWMRSENARARIRVLVKRILRKYGYPPDLEDAAVRTVLEQAEALSAQWAA